MKVKRILAMPFALAADIVTIGNFGDRMFTQQVFDAERREQTAEAITKLITEVIKAVRESGK